MCQSRNIFLGRVSKWHILQMAGFGWASLWLQLSSKGGFVHQGDTWRCLETCFGWHNRGAAAVSRQRRVLLGPCEHRANPSPPPVQDYQAPGLSRARGESLFRGFWLCIKHHNTFTFSDVALYFWLCWVFVAASGLSLVVTSGGYSWLRRAGFPLRCLLLFRAWAPGAGASVGAARGLCIVAHGLSCSEACGIFPDQRWSPRPLFGRWILTHQGSSMVRFPSLLLQNPKSHCWWTAPVLRHSADDLLVGAKGELQALY